MRRRIIGPAVLLMTVLSLSSDASEVPALAESLPAPEAVADERLYIVHFTTGPSWIEGKPFPEQEHAREHSMNLRRLKEQGMIALGARYDQTGMVILRSKSEEDARAEILADPSVRAGVFDYTLFELVPFFTGCVP